MWLKAEVQSPIAAISLNDEKAFHMVEWGYLLKILEAYWFSNTFMGWVQVFYKQPEAAVQPVGLSMIILLLEEGLDKALPYRLYYFA